MSNINKINVNDPADWGKFFGGGSKSKELFTPGEWKVEKETQVRLSSFTRIEQVIESENVKNNIEAYERLVNMEGEANARLIAASKDMYYALKPFELLAREVLDVKTEPQIIYAFNGAKITTGDLIAVLKAIQKAKGQQ